MKTVWCALAGTLIVAIFVTTLCAQSCVDPIPPTTECPAHHSNPDKSSGKNCCKHEDSTSDSANVAALSAGAYKSPVQMPTQMAHTFEAGTPMFFAFVHPTATLQAAALQASPPVTPLNSPLALRI